MKVFILISCAHDIAAANKKIVLINSFSACYPDIVSAERCQQCNCCTPCWKKCNCVPAGGDRSEVEQVLRILGIDPEDSKIQQAERSREMFVQEELLKIEKERGNPWGEDEDEEEEEGESEDDYEDDYSES